MASVANFFTASPVIKSRLLIRFNNYTPHVSREQELANRDILRSIGASEMQVAALSHRTFANLPRWARRRLKPLMNLKETTERPKVDVPKKYFLRHLNREELAVCERAHPKQDWSPVWVREDATAQLVRVV